MQRACKLTFNYDYIAIQQRLHGKVSVKCGFRKSLKAHLKCLLVLYLLYKFLTLFLMTYVSRETYASIVYS